MTSDEPPNQQPNVAAVILAAGLGTRMRSRLPKELHPIAGRPTIDYVLEAAQGACPAQTVLVLSPAKAALAQVLPDDVEVAWQKEQLGTGHAAAQALPLLRPEIERVAVLFADAALLTPEVVRELVARSASSGALVTLLTAVVADPGPYGRLRYQDGRITAIVEVKVDTACYQGPVEVNSGISCYRRDWLERALPHVPRSPVGEYYLTSLVELAAQEAPQPAVVSLIAPIELAQGVNDRVELAEAERVMRRRINERLMRAGVSIVDPASTFIDAEVEIAPDTRIEPFTTISGTSRIAEDCVIGPQAIVRDSVIGAGCEIVASLIEGAELGHGVHVGPFSHFRPGTRIADGVHVGNYVEVKNASLGEGTHVGHFSYLGDAAIGRGVNIGAGTITANYDGVAKHRTTIGDRAFIGSDTILRAPVEVGEDARTGAGAVVTRDVPPGVTVIGVPARPLQPVKDDEQDKDEDEERES